MSEQIVNKDSIEICTETFGDVNDPCILLIMGASASMIWWDDEFCKRLSSKKRFVIRYDNRDVGRSTCYEPGQSHYDVIDMADDSLAVLDYYGIRQAHFVGMSLGGMIAQLVAIRNPERVLTITAIASGIWDDLPELPPVDTRIIEYQSRARSLDWTDRKAVIDFLVNGWKLLNGSVHEFDWQRAYRLAETEVNRARNLLSMFNHAMLKGGEDLYGKSSQIKAPFLIIHGTQDPVLPFAHAEVMKKTIPNSTLLVLKGSGHEMHYKEWDVIIGKIIEHTGSVSENNK